MSMKPQVTKYGSQHEQEKSGCDIKRKNGNAIRNVSQVESKTVTKPVPGNMYIALENGQLVPVKNTSPIVTSSQKNITNSPKSSLNQEPSVSTINNQAKESPLKITKAVSLAPKSIKQKMLMNQNKSFKHLINQNSGLVENQITSAKKKNESTLGPNKKFKGNKATSFIQHNSPYNSDIDDCDIIEEELLSENANNEDEHDFSDASFAGSLENECTTPEYLYDELIDDEGVSDYEAKTEDSENKKSEMSRYSPVTNIASVSDADLDEVFEEEESKESCTEIRTPTHSNILMPNKSLRPLGILRPQSSSKKTVSSNYSVKTTGLPKVSGTPRPTPTKKQGATSTIIPKAAKINDKFPDLPVPNNINQYGDCLKTRLGRYHYGLTLNDPPCQFFQGVLKGATGQTLAAMFGDINLFSKFEGIPVEELGHIMIDTTFRVIPNSTIGVNHVLTIGLLFQNQIIPLWYAVTSCSSPELYKRILIEFQQHVLDWPFTSVLLNNDPALCKAVLALFPDIELYGSWFYYCNSIWKELTLNNLSERCKVDQVLMTAVKMLMVIPYLQPITDTHSSATMLEGFEVVRCFVQDNCLPTEFDRVMDFVAVFWFNKVKSENFCVFGKHTCSLNFVEIFQLSLLSYMKPNGNVWTLTHSFQSVARSTNSEFNRYLNGKPLATKKNRGKKFNVPIRQNMKKLLLGTYDVKTYLERCTIYCDEMLDIFLHPLYPTTTSEKTNYIHTEGWKIKIIDT